MNKNSKYFNEPNIKLYFSDIKNINKKNEDNNTLTPKELVENNLLLVPKYARKYVGNNISYMDLIQEGNIALIKAANTYDKSNGAEFSTYACLLIEQAIILYLARNSSPMRLPEITERRIKRVREVIEYFKEEKGYMPSAYEIAEEGRFDVDNVLKLLMLMRGIVRLDKLVADDSDSEDVYNFLKSDDYERPEQSYIEKENSNEIREILESLKPDELKLILDRNRKLINGLKSKTLKEIGEEQNVSRETIRKKENKIKEKIMRKARKCPGLVENVMKKG